MTPEQLNRAIADSEGWKFIPSRDVNFGFGARAVPERWEHPDDLDAEPEYTTSLDAIVPLVRKLPGKLRGVFGAHLWEVTKYDPDADKDVFFEASAATAIQIATAYAKTVGIWRDDE